MDSSAGVSKCRQLICLVKNRPVIYNFYLKEHKNRAATEEAWQDISNQLSISVVDCKAKWLSLRNCYGRALRGEKANRGCRRRTWYLADDMEFLREFMNRTKYFESKYKGSEENAERMSCNVSFPEQEQDNSLEASGVEKTEPIEIEDYAFATSPENESYQSNQFLEADRNSPAISAHANQSSFAATDSDADTMFFRSLIEDFKTISRRRQRAFKEAMLSTMNKLMDEEEAQQEKQFSGKNQMRFAQVKRRSDGGASDQLVISNVCSSSFNENSLE